MRNRLPAMSAGEALPKRAIAATQHFTEPPPRYSEASLVKRMEELGIGRPSTYASILQVLKDRDYVRLDKKRLIPEDKGRVVIAFLENFFARYVEYDFTAGLEEQLDRISNSELAWQRGAARLLARLHRRGRRASRTCASRGPRRARRDAGAAPVPAEQGRHRSARLSDLRRTAGSASSSAGSAPSSAARTIRSAASPASSPVGADGNGGGMRKLGKDPETGLDVTVRNGPLRHLPAARRSHQGRDGEEESRSAPSIPKGGSLDDIDLDRALKLLSLPREIGKHPEDGEPIVAGIGRFGPYVQHGKTYANLGAGEDVLTIGLNRAVTLIAEKHANPGKGRRFGADPGRRLGDHPQKGGTIVVKNGRYGPYVSHDGVNATLPTDKTPETITLDEAAALIDARAERVGGSSGHGGRRPARRTGAAKKAPAAQGGGKGCGRSRRSAPPRAVRPRWRASRSQQAAE